MNSLPADKLQEIQKAIELFSVGQGPAKTMEEATRRSYQFWDTQPVPKLGLMSAILSLLLQTATKDKQIPAVLVFHECGFLFFSGETVTSHGCIEPNKDSIREEPYSLPQGFSWDTLDLGSPAVVSVFIHTHPQQEQHED